MAGGAGGASDGDTVKERPQLSVAVHTERVHLNWNPEAIVRIRKAWPAPVAPAVPTVSHDRSHALQTIDWRLSSEIGALGVSLNKDGHLVPVRQGKRSYRGNR